MVLLFHGPVFPAPEGYPSASPDLDRLIEELRRRNPELQSMRESYRAAVTRAPRASSLADPKFAAGWSAAGAPWPGAGLGEEASARLGFQVSQEIPFPGKRALRREQADSEARSEAFRLRNLELSLIARLKTAYHEWRGIDDQFRALDRQAEVIRQLESAGEARYATGGGRQQDLWMVRLESIQLDARRIPLRHRQSALLAEIGALVDLPPDSLNLTPTPDLALPPPPEPVSLAAAARRSSPVTAEQRVEVDVRRTGVEIARRDYYPDFEIMAGYYNMGRMKDMWEAQVRINIPLWFADRQRPALEESVARLTAAERRVRAVETDLAAKIAARSAEALTARETLALYQDRLLPEAELALEASISAYETGDADLGEVLERLKVIADFQQELPEIRTRYWLALVELELLTGQALGA